MNAIPDVTRLRLVAEVWLWRQGWAWLLAASFGLVALVLHASTEWVGNVALLEATRAVDQAKSETTTVTPSHSSPSAPAGNVPDTEQHRLRQLQQLLGGSPQATELVRQILVLAHDENITVAQSEYQHQADAVTGTLQVQVTQPVRATYPQLRRYVEAVLLAIPNASLDQIAAKRESVDQTQVQARLKWSLWLLPATTERAAVAPAAKATP